MKWIMVGVGLMAAGAASAQTAPEAASDTHELPPVTITADRVQHVPSLALRLPDQSACDFALMPPPPDATDGLRFAAGPLDQLSPDDRAFANLGPFLSIGWSGGPRINAMGAPLGSWIRLRFERDGWHVEGC
jgi:hypothetical protein